MRTFGTIKSSKNYDKFILLTDINVPILSKLYKYYVGKTITNEKYVISSTAYCITNYLKRIYHLPKVNYLTTIIMCTYTGTNLNSIAITKYL